MIAAAGIAGHRAVVGLELGPVLLVDRSRRSRRTSWRNVVLSCVVVPQRKIPDNQFARTTASVDRIPLREFAGADLQRVAVADTICAVDSDGAIDQTASRHHSSGTRSHSSAHRRFQYTAWRLTRMTAWLVNRITSATVLSPAALKLAGPFLSQETNCPCGSHPTAPATWPSDAAAAAPYQRDKLPAAVKRTSSSQYRFSWSVVCQPSGMLSVSSCRIHTKPSAG
jgi:hypothetical protein